MGKFHDNDTALQRAICEQAAATGAICWWCGSEPLDYKWQADHVVPLEQDSPLVAACRRCNRVRTAKVPQLAQWQRLLYSDQVVRSCSGEELAGWLDRRARKRFGEADLTVAKNVLVAKVYGQPMYYAARNPLGSGNNGYARRENKLWEKMTNTQDPPIGARINHRINSEIERYHAQIQQTENC